MIPNNWVFYPKLQTNGVTTFDNQTIIGSTEVVYKFLTMTRMFTNLPKHTSVGLRFNFFQIDNYENCKVNFFVNENVYPYKSTLNWRNMGTNSTPDAIVPQDIELPSDISDTVNFTVQMSGECKMGVNSLQLYLYGCPDCNPYLKYRIENMPYYDVSSPPKKGIKVKYIFDTKFNNSGNLLKTFALGIVETGETPLKNYIPVQANSASVTGNKSILLTIDPHSS